MTVKSGLFKLSLAFCLVGNIVESATAQNFSLTNYDFDDLPSLGQVPNQNGELTDILLGGLSLLGMGSIIRRYIHQVKGG
ncbi:MAG: hypothetical protein WBM32_00815 [Crocosphaera sp.]